jgi:hypothetical protein
MSPLQEDTVELRGELARAKEREAAVRDVIQTLARTSSDLDAVLQTVIDRAVRLTLSRPVVAMRVGRPED